MSAKGEIRFYMCPRCLAVDEAAGFCSRCQIERLGCRPGERGDPCRRPRQNAAGDLLSRAPIWWLDKTGGFTPGSSE